MSTKRSREKASTYVSEEPCPRRGTVLVATVRIGVEEPWVRAKRSGVVVAGRNLCDVLARDVEVNSRRAFVDHRVLRGLWQRIRGLREHSGSRQKRQKEKTIHVWVVKRELRAEC